MLLRYNMFALFERIISENRVVLEMRRQWCAQSLERQDSLGDCPLDKLYQHKTVILCLRCSWFECIELFMLAPFLHIISLSHNNPSTPPLNILTLISSLLHRCFFIQMFSAWPGVALTFS